MGNRDKAQSAQGAVDAQTRRGFLVSAGACAASATLGGPARAAASETASSQWDYRCAGELAAALRDRRISALELVDGAIARIEALDASINAVPVRDFDRARAAARAADAALARGETGALLGVPVTVKESFNVAGLPTCWGDPRFRRFTPKEDALAVARLKKAGAVILGKTNVSQWLSDWQSDNSVYGTTNNPFHLCRTPGGSSGGSAAALAAGFGALSLGSDMGGSLREPAHDCGIYAHRPTPGLVPRRGHAFPDTPPLPVEHDLAVIGPMARCAADLALALDIVAGPDEIGAGVGYRLALPPPRHEKLSDFRVLIIDRHPLGPTGSDISLALATLAERLGRAGAALADRRALAPDLAQATRLHVRLLSAYWGAGLPVAAYRRLYGAADAVSPSNRSLAAERARGAVLSFREWRGLEAERAELQQKWRELFRDVDVVLCPAAPTTALRHDHSTPLEARRVRVDGKPVSYLDAHTIWAAPATIAGLPATVAPIAQDGSGLPIGVQIIGPSYEDRTAIAFATLVERAFGGFTPPTMKTLRLSCAKDGINAPSAGRRRAARAAGSWRAE
ncbi:amidase [Methylocystis echinoides]|uniref:amidase n=1 Tax=Methylocystis echinoides TaxID=29468 RepID=UPI00342FC5EE